MIIQVLGLLCLTSFCFALATPAIRIVRYELCLEQANATSEEVNEFFSTRNFDPYTEHYGFKCYATCILILHNILRNETIRFPPTRSNQESNQENYHIFDPAPPFSQTCGLDYRDFEADRCEYGFRLYRCLHHPQTMRSNSSHVEQ